MNTNDEYIMRKLFQLKLLLSDGNTFEQVFTFLMKFIYPDFQQVKPQGKYGDRKCDGYSAQEHLFCQVYAPENIEGNEKKALDKLEDDFKGLLNYWTSKGFIVDKFRYVVNDKYKGVYPTLHAHINAMQLQYPNINLALWTSGDMERFFRELGDEAKTDLINYVPMPSDFLFDNNALSGVVEHLCQVQIDPRIETIPLHVNTTEKIRINNLSDEISSFLISSLQYWGYVDEYFNNNNYEQRELLREKFSGLYLEGMNMILEAENNPDVLFVYIYKKACPDNLTIMMDISVRALMAYYFEACDIFKIPEQNDSAV